VYFGGGDQKFYALDAADGKLLWDYATNLYLPSGIVANGEVFVAADQFYVFQAPNVNGSQAGSAGPNLRTLVPDFNLLPQ
jgi:outer membrane protein assembly factor BamB